MEVRYLIDTNALIDYLAELMPADGLDFMDGILVFIYFCLLVYLDKK